MARNSHLCSLPDELKLKILTHLPPKSICQLKTLSKHWFSLISNPSFTSLYLSLSSSSSWAIADRYIAVNPTQQPDLNLSIHFDEAPHTTFFSTAPNFAGINTPNLRMHSFVVSSSNGLVLFYVKGNRGGVDYDLGSIRIETFDLGLYHVEGNTMRSVTECWGGSSMEYYKFVGNPVTGQYVELPEDENGLGGHFGGLGLSTRVRINSDNGNVEADFVVMWYLPIVGTQNAKLVVFSSETGVWEMKSANYMLGGHDWTPGGTFECDGSLYWVDLSQGFVTLDDPFSVVGVGGGGGNGGRVECGFVPLPDGCTRPEYATGMEKTRCCNVSEGCVHYMELCPDAHLRVWRLKKEGVSGGSVWSLVHDLGLTAIETQSSYLTRRLMERAVVAFLIHPFDANLGLVALGGDVCCVDFKARKVVKSAHGKGNFMMLFVLPSWPAMLPRGLYAVLEKNRGNDFFKKKKFAKAVGCYSKSITHLPTGAAFANRAAAYLKMRKFAQAESDCTEALKFDEKYIKAWARRAIARRELGKLVEAKEDAEFTLELDPQNREIRKLYADLMKLLEQGPIKAGVKT